MDTALGVFLSVLIVLWVFRTKKGGDTLKKITPVELADAFEKALDSFLDPSQNPNIEKVDNIDMLKKFLFPCGQLTQYILVQVLRQMELLDVDN